MGTGKHQGQRRPLHPPPLTEDLLQIGRTGDHAIDAPLAVVHPDGSLRPIDGLPGKPRDFPHPQATPPHEPKDGPISARVNDLEQADQVVLGHGPGTHLRHEDLMMTRVNGVVGQPRLRLEEGAEAPDHAERRMARGGR
jgi:hypothetical protein